ncbi:MAG: calcium/sodium antiporter [Dehalococcoidia bacterium]
MALDLLMTAAGIAIVLLGGYLIVQSAVVIALGYGLPRAVVGATVVAFGTSAPELTVGISAVLGGSDGVTVGDVMGSSVGNVGLVLGLAAVINPSVLFTRLRRTAVPVLGVATALFLAVAAGGRIERWEGGLLLLALVGVTLLSPRLFPEFGRAAEVDERPASEGVRLRDWAGLAGALVALAVGASLAVDGAVGVAKTLGWSEVAIGVVVIAIGTSLPELITSILAAVRGELEIAVSNVLGSNIFNLLGVMGVVAAVGSVEVDPGVFRVEAPALVVSTVALIPFTMTRRYRITRFDGALLLGLYVAFLALAIDRGT